MSKTAGQVAYEAYYARTSCANFPFADNMPASRAAWEAAAAAVVAERDQQRDALRRGGGGQWVSVEDWLPDERQEVLIHAIGPMGESVTGEAVFRRGVWGDWIWAGGNPVISEVKHWMPMPAPPEPTP